MSAKELIDKQAMFVEHYCASFDGAQFNATQAAIKAGYAPKCAGKQAYQLLENPRIKAAIQAKQAEIAKKNDIKREDIINSVRNKQKANMMDYAEWTPQSVKWRPSSELTREQGARIKSLSETVNNAGHRSMKLELYDALLADKILAQMTGNITEKREHSGLGGKPIEHEHKGIVIDLQRLTTEEVKQYRELTEKATPKEETK